LPDYEIRLFHADGSLDVVHISHHDTEAESLQHARQLMDGHARFEVRAGGRMVARELRPSARDGVS